MIKSMTAYGRGRRTTEEKDITAEIKSVNSRYLDCSVKLPHRYAFLEDKIRAYIQKKGITRGKVDLYIGVDTLADTEVKISVDRAYTEGYLAALYTLRDEFHLPDDISVMRVAADRNVFTLRRAEDDEARDWEEISAVLDVAIDNFLAVRAAEGEKIEKDISAKIEFIKATAEKIADYSAEEIASYNAKLTERIKQILDDNRVTVDEGRILTEAAIYADRVAIDEELTRLSCHFGAFYDILAAGEPCGRKLDFLLQEINRETNTIGSKAQSLDIAKLVVTIKAELEKIREQIQNIE
ncbi:MAG: YicC family protein [Clostridia bacterium]|nr:YicC family protein [Clostridia bacterium]